MSIQLSRTMHRYHFYLTNYYLLLIPDLANLYNFILFTYKIEIHFFYPLSNNKILVLSSYKLSFVIAILIPDVTIKNTNYRILSTLCLSQNWNPPNFFCVEQRYLPQIWKRRDESHKLTISNISIISEPIDHSIYRVSRKIPTSRFHVWITYHLLARETVSREKTPFNGQQSYFMPLALRIVRLARLQIQYFSL